MNEACNKIWTTCEMNFHLSSHGREDWLCRVFSSGFSPSSTIPTLYYADISSMISILSFFGVGSFRIREGKKTKSYDLVRTAEGFRIVERQEHVKTLIGRGIRGWHEQVAHLYEGLSENGIHLPRTNMRNFRSLKADREDFHYGLLTKTTMEGAYGEKRFFIHLPHVIFVTRIALALLRELRKPLLNGCDTRFKRLVPTILPMGRNHFSRFSPGYLRLKAQVDATLKSLE